MEVTKKTKWDKDTALREMVRWCAADEKSHAAVRTKLIEHQIYGDDLEEILAYLISENFINELRFANAYVSGKWKINHWGRNKIKAGLKQKNVSNYNINKALNQIDEDEYAEKLAQMFSSKVKEEKLSSQTQKMKIYNYFLQKGFESHLILSLINQKK